MEQFKKRLAVSLWFPRSQVQLAIAIGMRSLSIHDTKSQLRNSWRSGRLSSFFQLTKPSVPGKTDNGMKIVLPLFPTYLFVHINSSERTSVLKSPGCYRLSERAESPSLFMNLRSRCFARALTCRNSSHFPSFWSEQKFGSRPGDARRRVNSGKTMRKHAFRTDGYTNQPACGHPKVNAEDLELISD
jgi:hypothetical protein